MNRKSSVLGTAPTGRPGAHAERLALPATNAEPLSPATGCHAAARADSLAVLHCDCPRAVGLEVSEHDRRRFAIGVKIPSPAYDHHSALTPTAALALEIETLP